MKLGAPQNTQTHFWPMRHLNQKTPKGKVQYYPQLKVFADSVHKYKAMEAGAQNVILNAKGELNKFHLRLSEIRQLNPELDKLQSDFNDKERLKTIDSGIYISFTALRM